MSKKLATLTFESAGVARELKRGDIVLDEDKISRGFRCKFSATLNKSDGGTTTLALADKLALMQHFDASLRHGPVGAERSPFTNVTYDRMREWERDSYQAECGLFSDTTNGLGKTVGASGDTAFVWWQIIPTGHFQKITEMRNRGLGRTQALNTYLQIRRLAAVAFPTATTTTLKAAASVTVDIYPDYLSGKDEECVIPEYLENNVTNTRFQAPDGMPLLIIDRNSVHTSTALTQYNAWIDSELVHYQAAPQDMLQEIKSYAQAQDVSDTDTILYVLPPNKLIAEVPTGIFTYEQPASGGLSTIKYGIFYIPILPEDHWRARNKAASQIRGGTIRSVSNYALSGDAANGVKDRLQPYYAVTHLDTKSPEFQKHLGAEAGPNRASDVTLPGTRRAAGAAQVAKLKAAGETLNVERLVRTEAAAIPGAVQSGRGYQRGQSDALDRIKLALGA